MGLEPLMGHWADNTVTRILAMTVLHRKWGANDI